MNQSKAIQSLITKFVDDLQDLFISDLISAVADRAGQRRAVAPSKPSNGGLPPGTKRAPGTIQLMCDRLYEHVRKNPGQRIEVIASRMGVTTRELNLPIKKLTKEGLLKTKGQKRATAYTAR